MATLRRRRRKEEDDDLGEKGVLFKKRRELHKCFLLLSRSTLVSVTAWNLRPRLGLQKREGNGYSRRRRV